MRKREQKTAHDLTEDEKAVLRSTNTPVAVRQYVSRQQDDIGAKTTAFRKVASAARAEREALMEVHATNVVRAKLGDDANKVTTADLKALEAQNLELQQRLRAITAAPAMAVYGDD